MSKHDGDNSHRATSGGYLTDASYLDDHYQAAQPEYETMLRMVGLRAGWRVLDVGCGGGSYLPLLTELVGPTGHIAAVDIEPDNVQRVADRIQRGEFACAVEVHEGGAGQLPFPDDSFDALWCANVTQYFDALAFQVALAEFIRVVKPGGLVALKEWDLTAWHFGPFPVEAILRVKVAASKALEGLLRPVEFAASFRQMGMTTIGSHTVLSEWRSPLPPAATRYFRSIFPFWRDLTASLTLPPGDRAAWEALYDVESPSHILHSPDFWLRESHIVTFGRVPDTRPE